jgi:hypothetical protein
MIEDERVERRRTIIRAELTQELMRYFWTREPDEATRGRLVHHIVNCPDCVRKARALGESPA